MTEKVLLDYLPRVLAVAIFGFLPFRVVADFLLVYAVGPLVLPMEARRVIHAYAEIGAYGGVCLEPGFSYDPRHEGPPWGFLAERPEDALATVLAGQTYDVERITVDHHSGRAMVTVRSATLGEPARQHTYELYGSGSTVEIDLGSRVEYLCQVDLARWRVKSVAQEHQPVPVAIIQSRPT